MFVHLGADVVIPTKEIVAIIDMRLVEISEITAEFFREAVEEDFVRDISQGSGKSMVITSRTIYISPISTMTLKSRAEDVLKGVKNWLKVRRSS
jgi:iron only hydrogenase large subunit-like protein